MERSLPTRLRLGQILMRSGAATREKLVFGWEQKVLFGDRLGTNLLATRAVSEEGLARALGEQHLVPAAFGGNIAVKDAAIRRIARTFAVERMVVPHHFDAGTLYLLMRDPDDIVTRHDVYRMTGMVVVPVVVAEARVWSLLAKHYGLQPSLRPIPLDDEDGVRLVRSREHAVGKSATGASSTDSVADVASAELMSEAEFNSLYVRSTTDELRAVDIAEIEREAAWRRASAAAPVPSGDDAIDDDAVDDDGHVEVGALLDLTRPIAEQLPSFVMPALGPAPSVARAATDDPSPRAVASEGWVARRTSEAFDGVTPDEDTRPLDPLPSEATPAPGAFVRAQPTEVPTTALSIEDATAMLTSVKSRDALLDIVLRAALSRFRRAALFTVFPTTIAAWRAAGEGITTETLHGYQVSLDERTVFKMVVESRAHYLGPLQTYRAHGEFIKRMGRKLPTSIAVLPILVGERVVNVIYGDNGHGASVTSDVGDLLILTSKISATFESLLRPVR